MFVDTSDHADRELARLVLKQITTEPRTYNQAVWAKQVDTPEYCGTTHCAAGWAVQLADPGSTPMFGTFMDARWLDSAVYASLSDGREMSYQRAGREALKLNAHEACWLFDATRTTYEVTAALEHLADHGYIDHRMYDGYFAED